MRSFLIWSLFLCCGCDWIWNGSVVNCSVRDFKCPDGYTPPGVDLAVPTTDDGGTLGGALDYTSIYVMTDSNRTTLVGTGAGDVRTFLNDGSARPSYSSTETVLAGKPIVGIWGGRIMNMMGQSHDVSIIVPQDKQILVTVDGQKRPQVTSATMHGLWVGAWTNPSPGLYMGEKLIAYAVGDSGLMVTGQVDQTGSVTWVSETLTGSPNLRAVAGKRFITTNDVNGCKQIGQDMGTIGSPCPDGIAWAVGDNAAIFQYDGAWKSLSAFTNRPKSSQLLAVAAEPTQAYAWVGGIGGSYAERAPSGAQNWVGKTPWNTQNIRAMCSFGANDVFAAGDGGAVFRYGYDMDINGYGWKQESIATAGPNLSQVSFLAINCSGTVNADARVSIVGSNHTFIVGQQQAGNWVWTSANDAL